jgi:predicted molibdopterin-dependent oxidoreductase YjgC
VRRLVVWDSLLRPRHGKPQVVLPAVTFAETQGSYTNVEGRVQFLRPVLRPLPPLREGWEVLAELSARLGLETDPVGIFALQRAAAAELPALAALAHPPEVEVGPGPTLLGAARP